MARKNPVKTAATKKRIEDAFWFFYCENDPRPITVSAVAERANINRSTFYEYFLDIPDVLESIESDLLAYMKHKATCVAKTDDPEEAARIAGTIFEERGEQLRVFLGKRRNEKILESAQAILGGLVVREMLGVEGEASDTVRYRAEFIAAGLIGAYVRWLEDGRPVQIEEVASTLKASVLAAAKADELLAKR